MKIKSIHIENFKSLVDVTIENPNPFTVFAGPNGSGKSNIFEAIEFINLSNNVHFEDLFGGIGEFKNRLNDHSNFGCTILFESETDSSQYHGKYVYLNEEQFSSFISTENKNSSNSEIVIDFNLEDKVEKEIEEFEFHRVFVSNENVEKQKINSDNFLSTSCSNLEKVLGRILRDLAKKEEIEDWLKLFIPEFDRIEVNKSTISGKEELAFYQKHYIQPFSKSLISDGSYNILCLLTTVFQADKPQFLYIEEPENGLHPKVIKELVNFFRSACEDYGHYIWLNTHSQTLVSTLEEKELILVDKVNGETKIKQFKAGDFQGLSADEAWFTNILDGGLPW